MIAERAGGWPKWRSAGVFLAVFAALNCAAFVYQARFERQRAADLLVSDTATRAGEIPRYDHSVGENLDQFWGFLPDAREQRLAVLVGMSQMYSINDPKPEDRAVPEHLDAALAPFGTRVFGLVAPNLDNEEALMYLLATAAHPETKPSVFIYGVCFDKYRNTDIRPGLQGFMRRRPDLLRTWKDAAARYRTKYPNAAAKMLTSLHDIEAAAIKSDDTSFESRSRAGVGRILPLVAARTAVNGQIFAWLFELRNWVLRIKASTKRPIIGARYELNLEFMDLMADEATARGIDLLSYIIPLNPTAETPYVRSEYVAFKSWLAEWARRHDLKVADLDAVVPPSEWGVRNGEPDFKHFKGEGHRLTAEAVVNAFRSDLLDGAR